MFNIIENPISADIQIQSINAVALESGFVFRAEHKFENFVLTVCEINLLILDLRLVWPWQSKEESWSPKIMSKIRGGEDIYSPSGKVDDIFVLSADIT